jgi:hypothetical protein
LVFIDGDKPVFSVKGSTKFVRFKNVQIEKIMPDKPFGFVLDRLADNARYPTPPHP